ncbi:hypothetical protein AOLI_G00032090 [Acnodon oligacanthus]
MRNGSTVVKRGMEEQAERELSSLVLAITRKLEAVGSPSLPRHDGTRCRLLALARQLSSHMLLTPTTAESAQV